MNTNPAYKKKFEQMLGIEEKARDLYKYHVNRIKDPPLLEKFQEMKIRGKVLDRK